MKGWVKIVLLIVIIFICVGSFYYLMFSSLFEGPAPISRDSYLQLDIYGELPERESPEPLSQIFAAQVPVMGELLQSIRKAKIDDNIKGLIIRPMGLSTGWAKIEELKQTIEDFKTSGKKVYVYLEVASNREYYLALSGDTIFGSPEGLLFINGLLGGGYFLKGTLDKLGIEAEFIEAGKYKNYPEMFTRSGMSPAAKEMLSTILDDIFRRYLQEIEKSRGVSARRAKELIDKGIYSLKDAYKSGIIDTLMYYNEFTEFLKEKERSRPGIVSYSRYKEIPFSKLGVKAKEYVALIYAVGSIVSGFGGDFFEDGLIVSENMAKNIKKATEDKSVKAIVLRVNSPGGSGIASDIIWKQVKEARTQKPVIISISDVAASGGYYISMAADTIYSQPSALVGSIGVFSGKFSVKGLYEKLGINKEEIPRGKNADIFSDISLFNDSQEELIREIVMQSYQDFISKAAEGRKVPAAEIREIAGGRVWTGEQAVQNGLIDKLGGLEDAIRSAKIMAGISPDTPVKLKVYPKQRSILERLMSGGLQARTDWLKNMLPTHIIRYARGFLFYRDYEPLLLIPFVPEIK